MRHLTVECLVGRRGRTFATDMDNDLRRGSYYLIYKFCLKKRKFAKKAEWTGWQRWGYQFLPKALHEKAAMDFFRARVSTPAKLIRLVKGETAKEEGWRPIWGKLLTPKAAEALRIKAHDARWKQRRAEDAIWKRYEKIEEDPLGYTKSWCAWSRTIAVAKKITDNAEKTALERITATERAYKNICLAAWVSLFRHPANRIDIWKK